MVLFSEVVFWIIVALMVVFLMLCVWAGFKGMYSGRKQLESTELNQQVYSDELSELSRDLKRGAISLAQFNQGKEEIYRRAIEDAEQACETEIQEEKSGSFLLKLLLCAIPVLALILYIQVGNPSLIPFFPEKHLSSYNEQGEVSLKKAHLPSIEEMQKYLKESPEDARGWLTLGRLYNEQGAPQKALDAFNKAFSLSPDKINQETGHITERALTMLQTERTELIPEAKKELERAVKIDPQNVELYEILGLLSFRMEKYSDAVSYWSEALNFYPEDSPKRIYLLDAIAEAKNRSSLDFFPR